MSPSCISSSSSLFSLEDLGGSQEHALLQREDMPETLRRKLHPSQLTAIYDVPLEEIHEDLESFQGRSTAYSEESVTKIMYDIEHQEFYWEKLDPCLVWYNPEKARLEVLAGHSRREAFRRASSLGYVAAGRGFASLPAKILTGISKEEAIKIARDSNILATPETLLDRARLCRIDRLSGIPGTKIRENLKRMQQRNAILIWDISFVNPHGKMAQYVQSFRADTDQNINIQIMAQWTGKIRQEIPQLSDVHEDALTDYLMQVGGKSFGTYENFAKKIHAVVNKYRLANKGILPHDMSFLILESSSGVREVNRIRRELEARIRQLSTDLLNFAAFEGERLNETEKLRVKGDSEYHIRPSLEELMERSKQMIGELLMLRSELARHVAKEQDLFQAALLAESVQQQAVLGEMFIFGEEEALSA